MKKIIYLNLILCLSLFAQARQVIPIDTIPVERYITDFKFNPESSGLSFVDMFLPDKMLDRKYVIRFYHFYKGVGLYDVRIYNDYYEFGYLSTVTDDKYELYNDHVLLSETIEILCPQTKGNTVCEVSYSQLRNILTAAYKRYGFYYKPEEEGLRVVVDPYYINAVSNRYVSYYSVDEYNKNCFLINYFDIHKQTFMSSFPHDVFYTQPGGTVDVVATVYADNEFDYKWEGSSDKKSWQTMDAGNVSMVDAKSGATIRNKYPFKNNGEHDRYVRVVMETFYNKENPDAHGIRDTTDIVLLKFQYPFRNSVTGAWTDHSAGETIQLQLSDCVIPEFESDLPISVKRLGNTYEFSMPACPVEYKTNTPYYTVRFLNVGGTLLKEQRVLCGNAATPPSNPTFAGMTFAGWQGDYSNITSDRSIYAAYKVDGFDLQMSMDSHTSQKAETDLYVSHDGEDFAGSQSRVLEGDMLTFKTFVKASKTATVYFERATFNDNSEIISWGQEKVATLTDSEAKAGKWITYQEQIGSVYSQKKRTAYRFSVSGYSVAQAYSNMMEFEVWHPLTVNADRMLTISNHHFSFTGTSSVIPVFDMDTLRVATAEGSSACDLTFKCANQFQQKPYKQGSDDEGQYVILFGMKDILTVSVRSFTVKFIINGSEQRQTVLCSASAQAPEVPAREGYIFCGWKTTYSNVEYGDYGYTCVTEDMSFTAEYEKKPAVPVYDVSFLNYDGSLIVTQQVPEGQNATPPQMLVREGYTFLGWDNDWHNVQDNLTLTAQYEIATGMENLSVSTDRAKKHIVEGNMYIMMPDGKEYNILGTKTK